MRMRISRCLAGVVLRVRSCGSRWIYQRHGGRTFLKLTSVISGGNFEIGDSECNSETDPSAVRQDTQRSLVAVKEMAKMRGETYLELAKSYLSRRDYRNAKATALEGKRLGAGPFHLAVRDRLDDVLSGIDWAEANLLSV